MERERTARAARGEDHAALDRQIAATRGLLDQLARGRTADGLQLGLSTRETGIAWLDRAIHKARENPSLLLYKLQSNAYKFSWVLIPLSVPFLWLVEPIDRTHEVYRLDGARWTTADAFADDDRVRPEPFEQVELELARCWLTSPPEAR